MLIYSTRVLCQFVKIYLNLSICLLKKYNSIKQYTNIKS